MNKFIGRKKELQTLEKYLNKDQALVLIEGDHFIGKTELVKNFIKDKKAIYFNASELSEKLNRQLFYQNLVNSLNIKNYNRSEVPEWSELFNLYIKNMDDNRILVIDNFDYLVQEKPEFLKEFYLLWNEVLKPNNIFCILTLSRNNILNKINSQKNKLIETLDLRIKLNPISFIELVRTYPKKDFLELISLYNITGGNPLFWTFFENTKSIIEQINKVETLMLETSGFFYDLPLNLLEKDTWEITNYLTILFYIAHNNHSFKELLLLTGMKRSNLSQYLKNLELLGYIRSVNPINKSNKSLRVNKYYINNPFIRFWFRFIFSNRSTLNHFKVLNLIKKEYLNFIEETFNDISLELFLAGIKQKSIEFTVDQIGSYWDKDDINIPIVAVDQENKKIFFADTNFSLKNYTIKDFLSFIKKVNSLKYLKRFKDYEVFFGLFTAVTPTKDFIDYAFNNDNIIIFSGPKVFKKNN